MGRGCVLIDKGLEGAGGTGGPKAKAGKKLEGINKKEKA
jgi:hypothetical protein